MIFTIDHQGNLTLERCVTKRLEQYYEKALKTGFVETKGQLGPLPVDSKT